MPFLPIFGGVQGSPVSLSLGAVRADTDAGGEGETLFIGVPGTYNLPVSATAYVVDRLLAPTVASFPGLLTTATPGGRTAELIVGMAGVGATATVAAVPAGTSKVAVEVDAAPGGRTAQITVAGAGPGATGTAGGQSPVITTGHALAAVQVTGNAGGSSTTLGGQLVVGVGAPFATATTGQETELQDDEPGVEVDATVGGISLLTSRGQAGVTVSGTPGGITLPISKGLGAVQVTGTAGGISLPIGLGFTAVRVDATVGSFTAPITRAFGAVHADATQGGSSVTVTAGATAPHADATAGGQSVPVVMAIQAAWAVAGGGTGELAPYPTNVFEPAVTALGTVGTFSLLTSHDLGAVEVDASPGAAWTFGARAGVSVLAGVGGFSAPIVLPLSGAEVDASPGGFALPALLFPAVLATATAGGDIAETIVPLSAVSATTDAGGTPAPTIGRSAPGANAVTGGFLVTITPGMGSAATSSTAGVGGVVAEMAMVSPGVLVEANEGVSSLTLGGETLVVLAAVEVDADAGGQHCDFPGDVDAPAPGATCYPGSINKPIRIWPNPFAATSFGGSADPMAATSLGAGPDPFAATVVYGSIVASGPPSPSICPAPLVWQTGGFDPGNAPAIIWAEWTDSLGVLQRGQLDTNPPDPPDPSDIDWSSITRWVDINAVSPYPATPDPSCPDVIPWQPGGAEGGAVPSLTPVFATWINDLGATVHGEVDVSTTDPSGDVDWTQIEEWVDPDAIV